ncbi:uncharacterized protein TERG_00602 [Trichophyton rubrum CBS 118892]|uniref:TECPR1-like DysF domain-containing protein n=1 Tax=Trichophyton rubrum (strain ATCC MYA-4607 / CBS 118892) TaxID=559305 RepID=F2SC94_TRIRC|nr:uncharacterized protein TERG_00602 [Trichophyton rubrum CBS 118892]EGD84320.2 hypothetical protein TERG_00602 [Trichophyton rubrum CBS 118892]
MDEYTAELFSGQDGGNDGDSRPLRSVEEAKPPVNLDTAKEENSPGLSLQDRLLARFLQQLVPSEDAGSDKDGGEEADASSERPPFSLPTMTNNFRRFNARIGIVFRFQYNVIKLLSWRHRTQTWSLICVYSFICLDPYLLAVLPFVLVLLLIMIPAFLTRHPPPPPSTSTSSTTPYYSYEGPALAPAKTIKPAAETSKDFFHNMRNLQNSMADFAALHDAAVSLIAPATNFSDEKLSSSLFIAYLECREWVMERMVTGVEFEIPDNNDGIISEEIGGWVWDLPFNRPDDEHAVDILAYTDSWESPRRNAQMAAQTSKRSNQKDKPEWEEATKQVDRAGDWRRRRWVRVVRRMTIDEKAVKATPVSS